MMRYHASAFPAGFDHIAQELSHYFFEWSSSCHQRLLGDAVQLRSFGLHLEALRGHVELLGGDFCIYGPDRISKLHDPLEAYFGIVNSGVEAELSDVMLVAVVLSAGHRHTTRTKTQARKSAKYHDECTPSTYRGLQSVR